MQNKKLNCKNLVFTVFLLILIVKKYEKLVKCAVKISKLTKFYKCITN
jgi:hypothetical protein